VTAVPQRPAADPRVVPASTVSNLRDLGGTPLTAAGDGTRTVRPGVLLRSAGLDRLDLAADPAFAALGIRTVVDLRTAAERDAAPDRVPPGARHLLADALDQHASAAPARLGPLLAAPVRANAELGGGKAELMFTEIYRGLVLDDGARAAYRTLITAAADPDNLPLLFHCTAGKDRTGWGATVLLLLLGADEATATAEYLAVDPVVRATFAPYLEPFITGGGDPEIAAALIGVRPAYLAAALDAMVTTWGDVESYVRDGLGVPDSAVAELRTAAVN
jgi:protein-tyrosine phosphatase